jgi:hypothetical protein
MSEQKKYLIGIDDTDNKFSRGTGFRSRHLSSLINNELLGDVISITRHQLYVHPDIPFTSQNSSACLEVKTADVEKLKSFCQAYLKCECAVGSDVGLCIAEFDKVNDKVITWGKRAKTEVLSKNEANAIAAEEDIYLEGFLGTLDGIIGALAAVGLRKSGDDGRFIWLMGKELRDFSGIYSAKELYELSIFDEIVSKEKKEIRVNDRINISEWIRPVLSDSKISVIVEPVTKNENYEWQIASKEFIKSISN